MGRLLILSGMAGSGKTSCAKALIEKSTKRLVPLDPDLWYMPVVEYMEQTRAAGDLYASLGGGQNSKEHVHTLLESMEQGLFKSVTWMLDAGNDVLLTHALLYYITRGIDVVERFEQFLAPKHQVQMVWLDVPEQSLQQRLKKRSTVWDLKTLVQWQHYVQMQKRLDRQCCVRLQNPDGQQSETVDALLRLWQLNKE